MKLDREGRYEIQINCIEYNSGNYGNCYRNLIDLKNDSPFSGYRFVFVVIDTYTNLIPDECNDWNDSVEEAIWDYEDNVLNK